VNDPLIWLRACHFSATASLAGALLFHNLIGKAGIQMTQDDGHMPVIARRRLFTIVWISFVCVVVTGAGWFLVQAARMADVPLSGVFTEGAAWTVLFSSDFGNVSVVRAILAALFAAAFLLETARTGESSAGGVLSTTLGVALAGGLAFVGHASAESEIEGWVHLSADFLHLIAAAAWLGSLLPLALVLNAACANADAASIAVARIATLRFSRLGITSAGTLVVTGVVNSWILVGDVGALTSTDYGRVLSLKLLLFVAMLSIAAVNRLRLTPKLPRECGETGNGVLRQLRNNSLMEVILGLVILYLVGILGTLPPGSHE
jgi:putative copper resistance protein D